MTSPDIFVVPDNRTSRWLLDVGSEVVAGDELDLVSIDVDFVVSQVAVSFAAPDAPVP